MNVHQHGKTNRTDFTSEDSHTRLAEPYVCGNIQWKIIKFPEAWSAEVERHVRNDTLLKESKQDPHNVYNTLSKKKYGIYVHD